MPRTASTRSGAGRALVRPLFAFLRAREPSRAVAAAGLRLLFAAMFTAQTGLAALLATALALLTDARPSANPLLSGLMAGFSLLQLPLALWLWRVVPAASAGRRRDDGDPTERPGDDPKARAVAATLLFGVLLAAPAWFAAFALLAAGVDAFTLLLLAILVGNYAVGFALTGRVAREAGAAPADPRP